MSDQHLNRLLADLGDAIRDIPESKEHRALVDSFFSVIHHLQSKNLIPQGGWKLNSLQGA